MYAMIETRPDLAFTVATLAKFTSAPTAQYFAACKRVMRCLQGTASYGLLYSNESYCVGYTDSDYGRDKYKRRSTSGYVFNFGGAAISWKSDSNQLWHYQLNILQLRKPPKRLFGSTSSFRTSLFQAFSFCTSTIKQHLAWPRIRQIITTPSISIDIRYHFILTKALPKATSETHKAGMGISIFS